MKPSRFPFIILLWMVVATGCHNGDRATRPSTGKTPSAPPKAPAEDSTTAPEAQMPNWDELSSTSVRNPNDGSLVGGVPLPLRSPGLRFNPIRDVAARYGTLEMVRALVDAAAVVGAEYGGEPVLINDLSLENGGPIPRHGSHQSGRDVDVLFYQLDTDGNSVPPVGAFFDPEGTAIDFRDLADPSDDIQLRFDTERTWRFVQALVENEAAGLQSIYVAEHLRKILLTYAREQGIPKSTLKRFAAMTCQPEYPHDDHFHFRFFCTPEDIKAGCRDSAPLYPWRKSALSKAGVTSQPLLPKRAHAKTKKVTHEEARQAAGPLDPEVERWLDLRKRWRDQPHPGRKFCR